MELRPPRLPPPPSPPAPGRRLVPALLVANLVAVILVGVAVLITPRPRPAAAERGERHREVASRLKAAGALDEAARRYERYLESADAPPEARAGVAYSLGTTYLELGEYERALGWLFEAEEAAAPELSAEIGKKIVHCLERLGRPLAASAALAARVELQPEAAARPASDPVVAVIGEREVRRSEVERALDDLPPALAAGYDAPAERARWLEKYVADELLWLKAVKLELDRDPAVLRGQEAISRQLAISRLVEKELVEKMTVDEADLATWFEAHRDRYRQGGEGGEEPRLEKVRPAVERDYRLYKLESGYRQMIEAELTAAGVELFPERMKDAR